MNIHTRWRIAARSGTIAGLLVAPLAVSTLTAKAQSTSAVTTIETATKESLIQASPSFQPRSKPAEPLNVTVINMSGQSRQAVLNHSHVDLPVGRRTVLQLHLGETLHVLSDSDPTTKESFVISRQNAARILAVP